MSGLGEEGDVMLSVWLSLDPGIGLIPIPDPCWLTGTSKVQYIPLVEASLEALGSSVSARFVDFDRMSGLLALVSA